MVVQKVFWYLEAAYSTVPDVIFLFKLENENFSGNLLKTTEIYFHILSKVHH